MNITLDNMKMIHDPPNNPNDTIYCYEEPNICPISIDWFKKNIRPITSEDFKIFDDFKYKYETFGGWLYSDGCPECYNHYAIAVNKEGRAHNVVGGGT